MAHRGRSRGIEPNACWKKITYSETFSGELRSRAAAKHSRPKLHSPSEYVVMKPAVYTSCCSGLDTLVSVVIQHSYFREKFSRILCCD